VRLACSTDPEEPVRRPRRLAIAPRAAIIAGSALLILALALALRAVLVSTGAGSHAAPAAAAGGTESNGIVRLRTLVLSGSLQSMACMDSGSLRYSSEW